METLHVVSGSPDFTRAEVSVRWDEPEELVALFLFVSSSPLRALLFVRGAPWAVYDLARRAKYGGDVVDGRAPALPGHVAAASWPSADD